MPQLTWIQRVSNPLILVAEENKDLDEFTQLAKRLFKTLNPNSPPRQIIEAGKYYFLYEIDNDVCYLTLCDSSYPKKLAQAFIDEIKKEFDIQYGAEVRSATRPYAFIKFDTFIQKTKKLYLDTKSERNLDRVAKELVEVQQVMTRNIQEILSRGQKIDTVTRKSEQLVFESRLYEKRSQWLNTKLFWRKWAPAVIIAVILLLVVYLRFFWFY
jgi:vesicle transport protein SEC22